MRLEDLGTKIFVGSILKVKSKEKLEKEGWEIIEQADNGVKVVSVTKEGVDRYDLYAEVFGTKDTFYPRMVQRLLYKPLLVALDKADEELLTEVGIVENLKLLGGLVGEVQHNLHLDLIEEVEEGSIDEIMEKMKKSGYESEILGKKFKLKTDVPEVKKYFKIVHWQYPDREFTAIDITEDGNVISFDGLVTFNPEWIEWI